MFYKMKKRAKSESGQSMLEFILVFPILMLLIAMVLDYGWLFYNQIGMENAARNAARVACVEYSEVCLQDTEIPFSPARQEFKLGDPDVDLTNATCVTAPDDAITEMEYKILREVKQSMPGSLKDVSVYVEYTYDDEFNNSGDLNPYNYRNRSKGDVAVYVTAEHRAILPFMVAFGTKDNATSLERTLNCKAVYKVEKLSVSSNSNG